MATPMKSPNVWAVAPGEKRIVTAGHFVMAALFTGIGVVVGTFGSLAVPLGFVSAFWPGQAIQAVGSVWYGMWGGVASFVFPLISNALSGSAPLPVSLVYIPGNFVQGMLAGWAMRKFGCDPRLRSKKDWVVFTVVGVILANAFGAAWGSTTLRIFHLISPSSQPVVFAGWWIGNTVPSWILGVLMLKLISPMVIRTNSFVKRYWA
ncbi:MAG: hypothetical protein M0Z53_07935 [Thermaerobacter sp.]|nr:hypothetical protein [Thermaerobacter sp.]